MIGMFDSGVGGLTVMRQVMHALPHESIVYFGDTARLPYGEKSRDTIIRYTIDSALFLMEHHLKVLVIACHTASSYSLDKLRRLFNIPVIGVIEPSVERAVQATRNQRIAVIGTKGTINSGVYQQQILKHLPGAHVVSVACPLFVPLVEERFISHEATKLIINEYLTPVLKQGVDTLILGCTHYPLLRQTIEEFVPSQFTIIDPAITCAENVSAILKSQGADGTPEYKWYVSDDPDKFRKNGQAFLGMPLEHVEKASLFSSHF